MLKNTHHRFLEQSSDDSSDTNTYIYMVFQGNARVNSN